MNKLERFAIRPLLRYALSHRTPDLVTLGVTRGFVVQVNDDQDRPYMLVSSIDGDVLHGDAWSGHRYENPATISLQSVQSRQLVVEHYFRYGAIQFRGVWDLIWGRLLHIPYVVTFIRDSVERLRQGGFNLRRMQRLQQGSVLRAVLEQRLRGVDGLSAPMIMSQLHSPYWIGHPHVEAMRRHVQLYLETLAALGYLQREGGFYTITAAGIREVETAERDSARYKANFWMQLWMAVLTLVLTFFAAAQAGLVKFDPIFDWSGKTHEEQMVKPPPKAS